MLGCSLGSQMERKETAIVLISSASRWVAVLAILLSFLSAQQAWAALACRCDSHTKLTANASQYDREGPAETHHSACHHNTCDGETSEGSHRSGDGNEESSSAESPAIPGSPIAMVNSGAGASCCCTVQASPSDLSTLPFLTQQPTPVEVAPAVLVAVVSVTAVSVNIHGPPRPAGSRPLYIIQSSLLI